MSEQHYQISDLELYVDQLLKFNRANSDLEGEEIQHILNCLSALNALDCNHQGEPILPLYELQSYLKTMTLFFYDTSDYINSICLAETIPILLFNNPTFPIPNNGSSVRTQSLMNSFKSYFLNEIKPNGTLHLKLKEIKKKSCLEK
jgi:hypothetical protein